MRDFGGSAPTTHHTARPSGIQYHQSPVYLLEYIRKMNKLQLVKTATKEGHLEVLRVVIKLTLLASLKGK